MAEGNTRRALVAEPDREARRHLVEILKKSAAAARVTLCVDEASDGTTAMAMWSEHQPDLVLCEVLLEGVSGLALLRRMHAEHGRLPPVLLVTALTGESDRYWGLRNGAFAYVRKPFDDAALERKLHDVLISGDEATPERVGP